MYEQPECPVCGDRSRHGGDDRFCLVCFRRVASLAMGVSAALDDLIARRVARDSRLRGEARPVGEAHQRAGSDERAQRRRDIQRREADRILEECFYKRSGV